jgi:hypothetical protein
MVFDNTGKRVSGKLLRLADMIALMEYQEKVERLMDAATQSLAVIGTSGTKLTTKIAFELQSALDALKRDI